ncbi:hypothetical protein NUN68_004053 [Salmonella enterica subsp. enterica serovar Newport]|nr:hypothetical protein [Salmonella enterica subsp. enterica serovar Newport]EJO8772296.1 hypothetical protein [Salmonella enterica subsp. enterica serovar Newport]
MKQTTMMWWGPGLLAWMVFLQGVCAEPVAPRFPDMFSSGEQTGELVGPLTNQGQLNVSGELLISPCILSHWALETQGKSWISGRVRQITLALESCGDGDTQFGLARSREVPMPVVGEWAGGQKQYMLRLHNGENTLSLPAGPVVSLLELELKYE